MSKVLVKVDTFWMYQGAAEILSRTEVEHGKCTQSMHPLAVQKGTIRKSYGYKYATECIFIHVTLTDGRHLGYAN